MEFEIWHYWILAAIFFFLFEIFVTVIIEIIDFRDRFYVLLVELFEVK